MRRVMSPITPSSQAFSFNKEDNIMSMIEVVRRLQSQGHIVNFYVRKDGGILVKSIDGEKFPSGASGNARARQMVGASISEARLSQLKYATRARRIKKPSLDDEIRKEFERVKKKWNKAFKSKKGKPHPAGYFGWARIKWSLEHYGKEEALRRIREAERYASGIAYSKNVETLAMFIKVAGQQYNSPEFTQLAEDLLNNAYLIKESWIAPAYDELYKLNQGASPKDVAKNTRAILRL